MKLNMFKNISGNRGFTILEVLIAAMITGIITAAAFSFYVRMQAQSEAQYDIAETQHLCRASLHDIKKNLRMAGYKLPAGHPPYEINDDSLTIYRQGTDPVDTITYYLVEYNEDQYFRVPNLPVGRQLFYLMKHNSSDSSGGTQVFADYITEIGFVEVGASGIQITIAAQTMQEDMSKDGESYSTDVSNGEERVVGDYHTYTLDELVKIRNITS